MRFRSLLAGAVAAGTLTLAACAGAGTVPSASTPAGADLAAPAAAANAIQNPCFDSKTKSWTLVKGLNADTKNKPSGKVSVVSGGHGSCKHALFAGTTAKPAPNGLWGAGQTVKVTKAGKLTWWYWGATDEDIKYGSQQVDVVIGGKVVDECYSAVVTNPSTSWKEGKCSLSKYAGQTVQLLFGVYDNGYSGTYLDWYVSDISLQ